MHESPRRSHTPPVANRVKLKAFHKFDDTAEAVQSATALVEGKLSSGMKKFLKKNIVSKELEVCNPLPPARAPPARAPDVGASGDRARLPSPHHRLDPTSPRVEQVPPGDREHFPSSTPRRKARHAPPPAAPPSRIYASVVSRLLGSRESA